MPNDATDFLPTRRSLLTRIKDRDDQAGWREFFDTYSQFLYGVARKAGLTDAEAQDAVQETVIAVSKHIQDFKYDPAKCSFKTWLLLLTRQRIGRQFAKRRGAPPQLSGQQPAASDGKQRRASKASDDSTRTATIERIADPATPDLELVWDAEWQKHLLAVATERVKRVVKAEHFQMFDLYVLQGWPVRDVARTLGVSVARVYLAKHRIGPLLKKEIKALERRMI